MNNLKKDLKSREFKNVYLLYGDEDYLKRYYKNQLKNKVINSGDTMNYAHFDKLSFNPAELIDLCETMPFLSEYRLVMVEDSGVCKNACDEIADYISGIPETTILVFVESEIDKRNRVYKEIVKKGYAAEITALKKNELDAWIAAVLRKNNTNITRNAYDLFLAKVGTNLENIEKELNKLIDYTYGRESITENDVQEICTEQMENKIFDMIDAICGKQPKKALDMYYDLLALKEPPMRILFLISKQFNQLLKVKALREAGFPYDEVAKKCGMADWLVKKNLNLAGRFPSKSLEKCVEDCVQAEEDIKTGHMNDKLAVELLITRFSNM